MAPCKFLQSWLQQNDKNGNAIGVYVKKVDDTTALCTACDKKFSVLRGLYSINQHCSGDKHKENFKVKYGNSQTHLQQAHQLNQIKLFNPRDDATKAEILFLLRMILHNQSLESCKDLKEFLVATFPDSKFLTDFSISPSKARYVISEALSPYFRSLIKEDIQGHYSVLYDETTNKGSNKELQVKIKFWSVQKNEVVTVHLQTFFLEYAKADNILSKLHEAIHLFGLSEKKLLSLGSDGPNINKKVFRLFSEEVSLLDRKPLLDIGTCSIHTVHNAFLKALQVFGEDVGELLVAIKLYFKDRPSRWADYEEIQQKMGVPKNHFIKHVSSRWLTVGAASKRIIEQWPAITEYFLKFVPKKCSSLEKTSTYNSVKKLLLKKTLKPEIMFVISSSDIFTKFTGLFQKNEPLITILYEELKLLLVTLVKKVCTANAVKLLDKDDVSIEEIFKIQNQKTSKEYIDVLGLEVVSVFTELKIPEDQRLIFCHNAKKHIIEAASHIIKRIFHSSSLSILKAASCINPKNLGKSEVKDILCLSENLPASFDSTVVINEWNLLTYNDEVPEFSPGQRVDHYWSQIFKLLGNDGLPKYPNIVEIVKCILCLPHGNADVERGFSVSGRIVTCDRNKLSEQMLNSILTVADYLNVYCNKQVVNVTITKKLLTLARNAHSSYVLKKENEKQKEKLRLEEEEKQKENEKRELLEHAEHKRKISELEQEVREVNKIKLEKSRAATVLLEEAQAKLGDAIKKSDLVQANVAQGLISAAHKLADEHLEYDLRISDLQKKINKRKSDIIYYFNKKQKTDD